MTIAVVERRSDPQHQVTSITKLLFFLTIGCLLFCCLLFVVDVEDVVLLSAHCEFNFVASLVESFDSDVISNMLAL